MLLSPRDPPPVAVTNPQGPSPFLLIGDHAGNAVPMALDGLGLSASEISRHIGWDIGVAALGKTLAAALDASFIEQTFSRLVVDCNRRPGAPDAIAETSDGTIVPGNQGLSNDDRATRFAEIHEPYQRAIGDELARRDGAGHETVLVALHSFTPVMGGAARPWQIGVLYDGGDAGFARAFLSRLREEADLTVGDNEPYRMDLIDYTIPRHAYPARRPYVEIEVRQDLIGHAAGVEKWAGRIAVMLKDAHESSPSTPSWRG